MFVPYRAGGAQVRNAVRQTFQIGDAMTYAAALRVTGFALLALGCLLNARPVNADPVFGDRIQILLNPAPGSGSIFVTVVDLTQTSVDPVEGDITLPEGSKEKLDFYILLPREFIGYAAAKTTIFLSDDAGLSDALVVTQLTQFTLEFQFFSDGDSAPAPLRRPARPRGASCRGGISSAPRPRSRGLPRGCSGRRRPGGGTCAASVKSFGVGGTPADPRC